MEEELTKKQRQEMRKQQELMALAAQKRRVIGKKVAWWVLIIIVVIFGFYFLFKNIKTLPPITLEGHIEVSPPGHIVEHEMPENIQKHMLEHADGSGPPGVIVHYNCVQFSCESDLVEQLKKIVNEYPIFVYLAPGPRYDGKIVLTRFGKRLILDQYNEEKIRNFILNN